MRPRVFPAEDATPALGLGMRHHRFNEAAGIPRGRPPRPARTPKPTSSFNEAAGIPRGRRTPAPAISPASAGFNEAAGIPRGRLVLRDEQVDRVLASMRPRVFPAEDLLVRGAATASPRPASMRPRVFPAEDKARGRKQPNSVFGLQ